MPVKGNRKRKKPLDDDSLIQQHPPPSKQFLSAKARREKVGTRSYSIKQMRFNSFCKQDLKKDPSFRDAIRTAVRDVNQVIMEVYGFTNYHILRCFEKDKVNPPLPTFDVAFFQYCNTAVMTGKRNTTDDAFLEESKELYQSQMKSVSNYVPVRARKSINHILDKMAEIQIKVICAKIILSLDL